MKLTVIGGGGVRSMFLSKSIAQKAASLGMDELVFMDSNEKKLQKLTLILAIVWAVLVIVLFCLSAVGTDNTGTESSADASQEESAAESAAESTVESTAESVVESLAESTAE